MEYETDSDEEIESNNYTKQNQQCGTNARPTVMHNVDGPNAEDQIHVSHKTEPDFERLAFPKEFSTGQFH